MQNHQLAPEKYQFCDSCNERLMFPSETKNHFASWLYFLKNKLFLLRSDKCMTISHNAHFLAYCKSHRALTKETIDLQ